MSRIVKKAAERKREIMQKAQELFSSFGYDNTSINQIIQALNISKGAFYHHFSSKMQLLEAIVAQFTDNITEELQPILQRAELDAVQKLNLLFAKSIRFKADNIDLIYTMLETYYSDENLLLRHKLQQQSLQVSQPILQEIFRQGKVAGLFKIADSSATAEMILLLGMGVSDRLAEILAQLPQQPEKFAQLEALFIAYQNSIERILGAAPGQIEPLDLSLLETLRDRYAISGRK